MKTETVRKTWTAKTFASEGNKQVPKALKALASVAALAKYDATNEQINKVTTVLEAALTKVKEAFTTEETSADGFSL